MIQEIPLAQGSIQDIRAWIFYLKVNIQLKVDIRCIGMLTLSNRDKKTKSTIRYSLYYLSTNRFGNQFGT